MTLKTGSVPYLVGRPLDWGLEQTTGIQYQQAVPSNLVAGRRESRLDLALVSSIELFRRPGYSYIHGLGVGSRGAVDSVQVFLRCPMDKVKRIALDPSSRAAATLVRVLLADRPQGPPEYLEVPAGEDPREVDADAWLRIGDQALHECWLEELDHWNPAQAWTQQTKLPFVFAVWLVRDKAATQALLPQFYKAAERGSAAIEEIAEQGAAALGLPLEPLRHYLIEQCTFQPGAPMTASLELFGKHAQALGLGSEPLPKHPLSMGGAPAPSDARRVSCPD